VFTFKRAPGRLLGSVAPLCAKRQYIFVFIIVPSVWALIKIPRLGMYVSGGSSASGSLLSGLRLSRHKDLEIQDDVSLFGWYGRNYWQILGLH